MQRQLVPIGQDLIGIIYGSGGIEASLEVVNGLLATLSYLLGQIVGVGSFREVSPETCD
jgi:hypothetical protein